MPRPITASPMIRFCIGPEPDEVKPAPEMFSARPSKKVNAFSSPHALTRLSRKMYPVLEDLGFGIEIRPLYSGFSRSS